MARARSTDRHRHDGRALSPRWIGECSLNPEAYWTIGERCISKADTLYLSTIARSTGLLLGAAFAMLWRPVAIIRGPLRTANRLLDIVALIGLLVLALCAWQLHFVTPAGADPWLFRGGLLITDLATLMMIAAVTHRRTLTSRLLGIAPLSWVGTRSYGLYLYWSAHLPDHPQGRWEHADAAPVPRRDRGDRCDHRAVVHLRRDPDPTRRGRPVVARSRQAPRSAASSSSRARHDRRQPAVVDLRGAAARPGRSPAQRDRPGVDRRRTEHDIAGRLVGCGRWRRGGRRQPRRRPARRRCRPAIRCPPHRMHRPPRAPPRRPPPRRRCRPSPVDCSAIGDSVMLGAAGVLRDRGCTVRTSRRAAR